MLIIILIALLALLVISVWAMDKGWNLIGVISPIAFVISFSGVITWCFMAFNYTAAGHKAKIVNREYQTNYTQTEVFYASDVINTVRELNRQRIEVNGNLIRGDKQEH